jgi:hypothetical protein
VIGPVRLALVELFPSSFCIACRIESVAATVPAPDTYPVKTLAITGALVNVVALPTEVISPVKLALVMTVAAFPTLVTPPVRFAFVVTVPAVSPAAVPVIFVPTRAEGVPKAGVTRTGLDAKTTAPLPVVPFVI